MSAHPCPCTDSSRNAWQTGAVYKGSLDRFPEQASDIFEGLKKEHQFAVTLVNDLLTKNPDKDPESIKDAYVHLSPLGDTTDQQNKAVQILRRW